MHSSSINRPGLCIEDAQNACQRRRSYRISLLAVSRNFSPTPQSHQSTHHHFSSSRVISIPLPTNRLASAALQAIQVDQELSPFVRRSHALVARTGSAEQTDNDDDESKTVLETTYRATTNRMLRVSVNGFMETLGVVLGVMEELDVDVLKEEAGAMETPK